MKKILSIALAAFALASISRAQLAGVYSCSLNGGTNQIVAATTNTYIAPTLLVPAPLTPSPVWAVAEHPNVGVHFSCSSGSPSATNAGIYVLFAKSYDNGNSFEATPSLLLTNALPTALQSVAGGFTNRVFVWDISCANATHLALISCGNSGTTGSSVSNVVLSLNMNNGRNYTEPARR